MEVALYEANLGACPYLPNRTWITHSFEVEKMPAPLYESLLGEGWRRSAHSFYRNRCPGCACCTQMRVPVRRFSPSRSQRRVLRKNADVTVEVVTPEADEESFGLYRRYVEARHMPATPAGTNEAQEETPEQFREFLVESPLKTRAMRYRVGDRLVGIGWLDFLPDGLSSIYFAFEPEESRRSLGTFSFMREIDLARELGKEWLYVGFYVPGSPKMAYKGALRPREFAVDGRWTEDEGAIPCSPA